MQKLILFRQQIESLNDGELKQCITSFGRSKIETILFKGLFEELTHNKMDNLNTMNSIISNIKQSRKPKTINNDNDDVGVDSDLDEQIPIKLSLLPNVMICEISSFLEFSDQLPFEKSNRAIFIGSRSSIKPIHSLNGQYFMKLIKFCHENKETYLPKLRLFNSLTIDPSLIFMGMDPDYDEDDDLCFKSDWDDFANLFTNIRQLRIAVPWHRHRGADAINSILHHLYKYYHLSNIKVVRLINNEYEAGFDYPIDFSILSLITRNKFEYFEFNGITFKNYDIDYEFLKKLKGIAIHVTEEKMMKKICLSVCDNNYNLESLHFDAYIYDAMNGKINNLKELCLGRIPCAERDFERLIKQNMNCLERIYFHRIVAGFDKLKIWMNKIMKTLKYIGVNLSHSSQKVVLNYLDVLIESLGNVKKHRFKLLFKLNSLMSMNLNCDDKLEKLINILSLNCDHWMVICCDYNNVMRFTKKILMDKQYDIDIAKNLRSFIIKNKGCNINGYHENWSMECDVCRFHQIPK